MPDSRTTNARFAVLLKLLQGGGAALAQKECAILVRWLAEDQKMVPPSALPSCQYRRGTAGYMTCRARKTAIRDEVG